MGGEHGGTRDAAGHAHVNPCAPEGGTPVLFAVQGACVTRGAAAGTFVTGHAAWLLAHESVPKGTDVNTFSCDDARVLHANPQVFEVNKLRPLYIFGFLVLHLFLEMHKKLVVHVHPRCDYLWEAE